ncbi:MAG: ABC transporter substrate-binding protein [Sulfuriferula sp.]
MKSTPLLMPLLHNANMLFVRHIKHQAKFATMLVLALSAASATAAQPATLRIATTPWIGYGAIYVANSLDYFKKYNLKVTYQNFTDMALMPPALISGNFDGATLTYDMVVGQVAQGHAMKVVLPMGYSYGGDAIVATTDITKVTDFKGKKVGVNPLTVSDFLLAYALKKNGMTDKDINAINITQDAVPAAMLSGHPSIGVTWEPYISQLLKQDGGKKYHVVFSSKDAPGLMEDVLVFDEKTIKNRPADITAFVHAYADGLSYMKSHPEESAKIIAKALEISVKDVKDQLPGIYTLPLAEMPKSFVKSKETTSFYGSSAVIGQILVDKKQIKAAPSAEATFDTQFVSALLKK